VLRGETSDPWDRVIEVLFASFSSLGHRLGANFGMGTGKVWHVAEVAGRGASCSLAMMMCRAKLWVAAQASVVGLSGVFDGFSCASPVSLWSRSCGGGSLATGGLWRSRSAQA
jgi:hypothetical protein